MAVRPLAGRRARTDQARRSAKATVGHSATRPGLRGTGHQRATVYAARRQRANDLPQAPHREMRQPQRQVLDAVQALHWMTVSTRRGQQVETQAGIESGCPAGWKDVISLEESFAHGRSPRPSPGGRAFSPRPSWLRVCMYHDRSGPLDTFLIGGSRISGTAETALLAGIAAGRRSATCPQPHTMFAVLLPPQTGSLPAYVEIGGCQRVLRPDNRIGQASPAALMIINQARHS